MSTRIRRPRHPYIHPATDPSLATPRPATRTTVTPTTATRSTASRSTTTLSPAAPTEARTRSRVDSFQANLDAAGPAPADPARSGQARHRIRTPSSQSGRSRAGEPHRWFSRPRRTTDLGPAADRWLPDRRLAGLSEPVRSPVYPAPRPRSGGTGRDEGCHHAGRGGHAKPAKPITAALRRSRHPDDPGTEPGQDGPAARSPGVGQPGAVRSSLREPERGRDRTGSVHRRRRVAHHGHGRDPSRAA